MDESRFDALTRILTEPRSRRHGLGVLGVLGITSAWRAGPAAAKKRKKLCPPCKKRQKGKCKANLPDGETCTGGTCQGGQCVAACVPTCGSKTCGTDGCSSTCGTCTGQFVQCCNGSCVNLATDANNCGVCGRVCPTGQCLHGVCLATSVNQCPSECGIIGPYINGTPTVEGTACVDPSGMGNEASCSFISDCPLGSVCRSFNKCSVPC